MLEVAVTAPARAYLGEETEIKCHYNCTGSCQETLITWRKGSTTSVYDFSFSDPSASGPHPQFVGVVNGFHHAADKTHSLILLDTQWGNDTEWECLFYTTQCGTGVQESDRLEHIYGAFKAIW